MPGKEVLTDASYGIVPIRETRTGPLFFLIRHNAGHWGFPKGHPEGDETPGQAASREFREETGIRDFEIIPGPAFLERYEFARRRHRVCKTVTYFLARVFAADYVLQVEEVQDGAWLDYPAAQRRITFAASRDVLEEAHNIWQQLHARSRAGG